ncbi:radical SAM protein [Thiorhodococcus mannitoliphagus]|uniref:Radical SAM protein n=1 Tax=Thiorhodococcus mannitoliphagus TaxID=329406 RepID=A0A6P1DX77_9GAMM|nr:cobalamin-dependent protein [Thiorhodococcus mannitoliphagus]NEX20732.1 radical SAM protein [Thiorhodococcus mannitoliphagus]
MNILLINPPNCGRSIPEERYGITSIKQIFRGEPLGLEEIAGNLQGHVVDLLDLKVEPEALESRLMECSPDVVGITGVTCEANTMLRIAETTKTVCNAITVVGGVHASSDPHFFNHLSIDYIVCGLGKQSFAKLTALIEQGIRPSTGLPSGVHQTTPGKPLALQPHTSTAEDMAEHRPPAYDLVAPYRSHYVIEKLGIRMGFVASAFGCPYSCAFCSISGQTCGVYLTRSPDAVIRDIRLLQDIPVIRLVDANTFGSIKRATALAHAIIDAGVNKEFIADIRSDTVARHPEMLQLWKEAGLRAVIIGFEAIDDTTLLSMHKANQVRMNTEAITILHELGITIVGDFIIHPECEEQDFEQLSTYLANHTIDLPMITVMTPLPGTPLHASLASQIVNHDLDYYTLTNAVLPTRLDEQRFYSAYAELIAQSHRHARI